MLLSDELEVDAADTEGVDWFKDENVLFKNMDSGITGPPRISEFWNKLAISKAKLHTY